MRTPTHEQLFGITWRAALLLLPWQTRLILLTPQMNGFPWEQGTIALYVSWVPLVATIIFAWKALQAHAIKASFRVVVAVPLAVLVLASFLTSFAGATLLWWAHTLILVLFVAALFVRQVPVQQIARWFVLSLIPHVILGMVQFGSQRIWGSSFFGIAEQMPWRSGVSVVEYGEYRTLRAYGGFPHPNVFGGWLVVALLFLPEFIRQAKTIVFTFAWITCGAFFLYVLVLTFSRGAWIAAVVGLTLAMLFAFRRATGNKQREALIYALVLFFAALAIAVVTQWDAVVTRFQAAERLERWSIVQRADAVHDGFAAFKQHPVLGWGPGASLVGIAIVRTTVAPVPLEPPHLVPFLILLETGVLGLAAILALLWFFLQSLLKEKRWVAALPLVSALGVLLFTDHYLWTLWAGNALCAMAFLFLWIRAKETIQEVS